jgi:antitoxin YefM
MTVVTVNEAKRTLDTIIDKVVSDAEPMVITTESGQQIVLLSFDEYSAWQETIYLLSNPANAQHLRQSIAEAEVGAVTEHALIEK